MSDVTSSGDRRLPAVGGRNPQIEEIEIRGAMIRLGQLLKLADIVGSGGEAKALLAEGDVSVNGEPELRRGRQLGDGDVVAAAGRTVRVVAAT